MRTIHKIVNEFKQRFIFNNIKKLEYECLDYVEQNEDNAKTLARLDEYDCLGSFVGNLTTFIYKSKAYYIVRAFVHVILSKEDKLYLQVFSLQHSSINNNCKAKFEPMNKYNLVYSNINVNKLINDLNKIRTIDVLSKKDDKHFSSLTLNVDFEFNETLKNILNDIILGCVNAEV